VEATEQRRRALGPDRAGLRSVLVRLGDAGQWAHDPAREAVQRGGIELFELVGAGDQHRVVALTERRHHAGVVEER
jgi:hypothetical protein